MKDRGKCSVVAPSACNDPPLWGPASRSSRRENQMVLFISLWNKALIPGCPPPSLSLCRGPRLLLQAWALVLPRTEVTGVSRASSSGPQPLSGKTVSGPPSSRGQQAQRLLGPLQGHTLTVSTRKDLTRGLTLVREDTRLLLKGTETNEFQVPWDLKPAGS